MGRKRELGIVLDRAAVRKVLAVGHELDVNKNGLYDTRLGCVNIWCSPEDKPACWSKEVIKGDLNYPRDYVAGLYWDERLALFIEVEPYELIREKEIHDHVRRWIPPEERITEEEWEELFKWSIEKVEYLLNVSGLRFSNV